MEQTRDLDSRVISTEDDHNGAQVPAPGAVQESARGFPRDVTATTVRNLGDSVKIKSLKVAGGAAETLASGRIRVVNPTTEIAIMLGRLAGQRAYNALIAGEPGLSVEVRLNGVSHAREVLGTGRESLLEPGDMQITGSSFPTQWAVSAEPQHLFAAVAVRYSARYLESLANRVPDLSAWALSTISINR